ncbi:MAG: hypothetical protein ACPGVT_12270 [Maricaulaceae bacterium]
MSEPYLIRLCATLSKSNLSKFLSLSFPAFDEQHVVLGALRMDEEMLALNNWTREKELYYYREADKHFRDITIKAFLDDASTYGPFIFTYDEANAQLEIQVEGDENTYMCNMILLGMLQIAGLCERATLCLGCIYGDTDVPYAAECVNGQLTHFTTDKEPERLELAKTEFMQSYETLYKKFEALEDDGPGSKALMDSLNQLSAFDA